MTDRNTDLKREAWGWLRHTQTVFLATWDGKHPRVRPVSMIYDDERFWVSTGSEDSKVEQIERYPVFEFSMLLKEDGKEGTLRCSGNVRIVEDMDTKRKMSERIPFFKVFWETPEDPAFCLIELLVREAELLRPKEMTAERFSV